MGEAAGLHEADFGGPCRVCERTCFTYYEREFGKGMERVHANCKILSLEAELARCKSYGRNLAASLILLGKRCKADIRERDEHHPCLNAMCSSFGNVKSTVESIARALTGSEHEGVNL